MTGRAGMSANVIDQTTKEVLWRFVNDAPFCMYGTVHKDRIDNDIH